MIFELLVLGCGGVFLFREYKKDFPMVRKIAQVIRRIVGDQEEKQNLENKVVAAREIQARFADYLDQFRNSVATVKADHKLALQQAQEQTSLSQKARVVEEGMLRKGEDSKARIAAAAKVHAEKRAGMHAEHATTLEGVVKVLEYELDALEAQFEVIKAQAQTVEINAAITKARENLYMMISEVHTEMGLTPKGELEQLLLTSEREKFKTEFLIEMAKKHSSDGALHRIMLGGEIEQELLEARKCLSLPASEGGESKVEAEEVGANFEEPR